MRLSCGWDIGSSLGVGQAQEISAGQELQRVASSRRVDSSQLTFNRSYITLAKSPLAALLEGRNNVAPCKLVDCVRAQIEHERDFARVQQYVVFIGHYESNKTPFRDFVGTRFCNMRRPPKSR